MQCDMRAKGLIILMSFLCDLPDPARGEQGHHTSLSTYPGKNIISLNIGVPRSTLIITPDGRGAISLLVFNIRLVAAL